MEQHQKNTVQDQFRNVKNTEDLCELFNSLVDIEYQTDQNSEKRFLNKRTLNYYLFHKEKSYNHFQIPKKTGGYREIKAPDPFLKTLQRMLKLCFELVFQPGEAAHGFTFGKGIATNAQVHQNQRFVYNIDIKHFFPSSTFGRVYSILQLNPFILDKKAAYYITKLCCDQGCLPQGAPTSPILTNALCQRMDRRFMELARLGGFNYTRYADDITFSSNYPIFSDSMCNLIKEIINEEGYVVNEKKERLQTKKGRQEVTGLTVNEKVNVNRTYIRNLRAMLHNWANKGYQKASADFARYYIQEKGFSRNKGMIPPFESVVSGKLEFLKMVRGEADPILSSFYNLYNKLSNQ